MNKVYKKHSNNFILNEIFMLSCHSRYIKNLYWQYQWRYKSWNKKWSKEYYITWDDYKIKVDEDSHIKNIEFISDKVSNKFNNYLVNRRFRIGSSQKFLTYF